MEARLHIVVILVFATSTRLTLQDVYNSLAHMGNLIEVDTQLQNALFNFLDKEEDRMDAIERYIVRLSEVDSVTLT